MKKAQSMLGCQDKYTAVFTDLYKHDSLGIYAHNEKGHCNCMSNEKR